MNVLIITLTGLAIGLYGLFERIKLKGSSTYMPTCEIAGNASCSETLAGSYSALIFGIPNVYFVILFYAVATILAYLGLLPQVLFWGAIGVALFAAGVLVVGLLKSKNFCVFCLLVLLVSVALAWFTNPF